MNHRETENTFHAREDDSVLPSVKVKYAVNLGM